MKRILPLLAVGWLGLAGCGEHPARRPVRQFLEAVIEGRGEDALLQLDLERLEIGGGDPSHPVERRFASLDASGRIEAHRELIESLSMLVGALTSEDLDLALEGARIETGDEDLLVLSDPGGESGARLEFTVGKTGRIVRIRRFLPEKGDEVEEATGEAQAE